MPFTVAFFVAFFGLIAAPHSLERSNGDIAQVSLRRMFLLPRLIRASLFFVLAGQFLRGPKRK